MKRSLFPSLSKSKIPDAPTSQTSSHRGQTCGAAYILKLAVTEIPVQREALADHCGFENVRLSVIVDVAKIRPHAGHGLPNALYATPAESATFVNVPSPLLWKR